MKYYIIIALLLSALSFDRASAGIVGENDEIYFYSSGMNISDDATKAVGEGKDLSKVTTIKLQNINVSSLILKELLLTFPNANHFAIWGVNELDLSGLSQDEINRFESVDVFAGRFTKNNLEDIVKSKALTSISFNRNVGILEDNDLTPFSKSESLKSVVVDGDFTVGVVANFVELKTLDTLKIITTEEPPKADIDVYVEGFYNAYKTSYNPNFKLIFEANNVEHKYGY